MKLDAIMSEIAEKVTGFTGVNVFDYPVDTVTPPAGVMSYPERIEYDTTYKHGVTVIHGLQLWMIAGRSDSKTALSRVAQWAATSGKQSIKQFVDGNNYATCDDVSVTDCRFETFPVAEIEYVVAVMLLQISCSGE